MVKQLLRWSFYSVTLVWAVASSLILVSMVSPTTPLSIMMVASALGYGLNPALLLAAIIGAAIAVVGMRYRRRIIGVLAVVMTTLLAMAVVIPTISLAHVAAERGVALSLSGLLDAPRGGLEEPTETTTYSTVDGQDLQMDIWQAKNRQDAARSALIYVFGGGYQSGTRADWTPFFQHLTSQGISVFAMDYRLSTATTPSWNTAPADVACAVGWVRKHAAAYDIDADRLVLSGGSAGGNLALLTAYSAGTKEITPSCAVDDTSVRAVVDFYGPVDLAQTASTTPSASVATALEQYLGGTADAEPERYAEVSPASYITPHSPPTLILHGEQDKSVPVEQSILLAEELDAAGVPNELVTLPAAEHGFDAIYGSFANQIAQAEITRFFAQFVID